MRLRAEEIEQMSLQPGFWDDQKAAQALNKEKARAEELVRAWDSPSRALDDAFALLELANEAGDEDSRKEAEGSLDAIEEAIRGLELRRMLSGPNDGADAIIEINSGAGGTESMDWAAMLLRMYTRYCERQGWEVELADYTEGEEAGLKSASILVRGEFAYGFLKAEAGVHRLVRISPFDSQARRQTSFASVFVYPDIEADIEIDVKESDVRIDVYRSSGAGGQKVNKTSSAVRITHIATGIVVAVQNERSQHKNRDLAWKILKARLYELEEKKRNAEKQAIEETKTDIGWGSQIRSYVLAPYRLVKDTRTGEESSQVDKVLDGELQPFLEAFLLGKRNTSKGGLPE
ncbi:Peptide chain release factor 2 [Vulgatibacter incomptus]|uniref:Peptide chain release factor 2 n=1 Tax=Vulgatibacter incomptus TaxID=1391653 RepID=A0A0K1PB05_9BACT|nr:Peptide chain release factor 2 [Vulgatibacter incomptus]